MSQNQNDDNKTLNSSAAEYIPTKNRIPDKLNFNLQAAEYNPKEIIQYIEDDDDNDEQVQEEMDMILGDVVENEIINELAEQTKLDDSSEDSEDEDKWIPKYKDCECCSGFVYKCKGEACSSLGECYCKMKDDMDEQEYEGKNGNKKPEKMRN